MGNFLLCDCQKNDHKNRDNVEDGPNNFYQQGRTLMNLPSSSNAANGKNKNMSIQCSSAQT
jgi:hypothetical protein